MGEVCLIGKTTNQERFLVFRIAGRAMANLRFFSHAIRDLDFGGLRKIAEEGHILKIVPAREMHRLAIDPNFKRVLVVVLFWESKPGDLAGRSIAKNMNGSATHMNDFRSCVDFIMKAGLHHS